MVHSFFFLYKYCRGSWAFHFCWFSMCLRPIAVIIWCRSSQYSTPWWIDGFAGYILHPTSLMNISGSISFRRMGCLGSLRRPWSMVVLSQCNRNFFYDIVHTTCRKLKPSSLVLLEGIFCLFFSFLELDSSWQSCWASTALIANTCISNMYSLAVHLISSKRIFSSRLTVLSNVCVYIASSNKPVEVVYSLYSLDVPMSTLLLRFYSQNKQIDNLN